MSSAIGPGHLDGLSVLGHQLQAQGSWLQVSHAANQMNSVRCSDLATAGRAHCEHSKFAHSQGPLGVMTARLLTQAIKCFEAVVQAGVGTQPPAAQAAARLALARLLLAHTHNVAEARQHLERAVRAGSHDSVTSSACVRCIIKRNQHIMICDLCVHINTWLDCNVLNLLRAYSSQLAEQTN